MTGITGIMRMTGDDQERLGMTRMTGMTRDDWDDLR